MDFTVYDIPLLTPRCTTHYRSYHCPTSCSPLIPYQLLYINPRQNNEVLHMLALWHNIQGSLLTRLTTAHFVCRYWRLAAIV